LYGNERRCLFLPEFHPVGHGRRLN
jgi:hypothetical protein